MPIKACVFDAYGTLFDVSAAARQASEEPGRDVLKRVWTKLAADWRTKQIQYTWLRAMLDEHTDFWAVTQDGLDWAMEASGLDDQELRARLLALYWELAPYPEVPRMLGELKSQGITTAILSNGSPEMLDGAVSSAGIGDVLDAVLSVEEVGVFKPDARVYDLVGKHLEVMPKDVLFVSSNGWDAAGAAAYGFSTAWVNRGGEPVERLPARPQTVLNDLSPIPDLVQRL